LERPHTKESDWDGADRLERILKELTDPLLVRPSLPHLISLSLSLSFIFVSVYISIQCVSLSCL
jgi:hypothetical protein